MNPKYIVILILIISGLSTIILSAAALRKKNVKGSIFYSLMMIAISGYSMGYAFELYNSDLPGIMRAIKFQYLLIEYIPVFWFFLAAQYTGFINLTRFRHYFPFFIIPLISQILVFTSQYHSLYYINPRVEEAYPFILIHFDKAHWYFVQMIYTNIMILAGNILFGRLVIKSSGKHRNQAVIAFTASLAPWIGNILYITGMSPYGLDLTPLFLTITGPLFALAIFRYQMFDLVPVARSRIFDIISDPVIVFDNEYRMVDMNKSAGNFLGMDGHKPIGEYADKLLAEYTALSNQLKGSPEKYCDIRKDESTGIKYYKSRIEPIYNSFRKLVGNILILNDNTTEQLLIARLNKAATTDELTGINNRRNLMNLCSQEIARCRRSGRPLSLLMIDLDHFKKINDKYGHLCGDETLKNTAASFLKHLREGDILGRYGGEEFLIMLHDTPMEDACKTAERLRKSIFEKGTFFKGQKIPISISIGLAGSKDNEDNSIEALIYRADTALYRAKNNGRNRVEVY